MLPFAGEAFFPPLLCSNVVVVLRHMSTEQPRGWYDAEAMVKVLRVQDDTGEVRTIFHADAELPIMLASAGAPCDLEEFGASSNYGERERERRGPLQARLNPKP